jgi:hypothetical protein
MIRHRSPSTPVVRDLAVAYTLDGGDRVLLPASLRYDPADPIAVTLTVRSGGGNLVTWTFARRLLADGLRKASGLGDVRVTPVLDDSRHRILVSLSSADGHAELDLPRDRVETFLRQAFAAVPTGMEAGLIDWAGEFDPLLGPSRPDTSGSSASGSGA